MPRIQFQTRLLNHGLLAGSPAWDIVCRPGFELWNHEATHTTLVTQLCHNFHDYGFNHGWNWSAGVGGNGPPNLGFPLIAGQCTSTNCGGFNASIRQIADRILGIPIAQLTNAGATTTDAFITRAGTVSIDQTWPGNVCTLNQTFNQVQAYRFTAHSWNMLVATGQHFDASTNSVAFNGKFDLYWCSLLSHRVGGCYSVAVRWQPTAIPGPQPYYCLHIQTLKDMRAHFPIIWVGGLHGGLPGLTQSVINAFPSTIGAENWATYIVVSQAHLTPAFLHALL